ncbi:MAG: thioredoxin-dependent thiol peroxidase [Bacteroidales bacterium]|nr:thioredoxin-dependent thiol peroxidase [Bacteroidales bacterium]
MSLKIGDKAPEILGVNENGETIKMSDFAGKKVVLYFYPKDNTSGCTAEACSLRDGMNELENAGFAVIGVSKDSAKSHQGFKAKYELPFSLIADTEHVLSETFGAWGEKKLYGKTYMGMIRTTFIIDENGVITDIINKVDTKNSAQQILGR